jgi:hypothetical protein
LTAIIRFQLAEQGRPQVTVGELKLPSVEGEETYPLKHGVHRSDASNPAFSRKPFFFIVPNMEEPHASFSSDVAKPKLAYFTDAGARKQAGEGYPVAPIVGAHIARQMLLPVRLEASE